MNELPIDPLAEQESREKIEADLAAKRAVARRLMKKCDEVVKKKRPIEQRWIESRRQYNGLSRVKATKDRPSTDGTYGTPRIHATRAYTDRWEAQLSDLIKAESWDISPTPDAEVSEEVKAQSGQALMDGYDKRMQEWQMAQQGADPNAVQMPQPPPPTTADVLAAIQKEAEARCGRMRTVIQDQLANCEFPGAVRNGLRDICQLGSGLLMGPMTGAKENRKFNQVEGPEGITVQVEIEETEMPEIRWGDPWCFFPDMVPRASKAEFAFYLHLMTEREVRELANNPTFDVEQIKTLLKDPPKLGEIGISITKRNQLNTDEVEPLAGRYAVWRFTGCLEREDMKALGLNTYTDAEGNECECDELEPLPMVDMWFCQEFVLKYKPSPIKKDYRIPYFVCSPFPCDDTMFGWSLPDMCRDSQRTMDSAHAMKLHNASVTSGPIGIMRKGKVESADNSADIRGPKMFYATDADADLDDLMRFMLVPNNVEQFQAIEDRALQTMELELGAEQWMGEEASQVEQTASGMAMKINSRSVLKRRAAACADDEWFVPVIKRMYWWNMEHNPREDIKGDFDVVPKIQDVDLVKDVQAQQTLMYMQYMEADPERKSMLDTYEAAKAVGTFFDIPNKDRFILSREKWEAKQQTQAPDPQQQIAESQVQIAAANAAKAEADAAKAQAEVQAPTDQGAPAPAPADMLKMRQQQLDAQNKQADRDLEYYKIDQERAMAREKLQAEVLRYAAQAQIDATQVQGMLQLEALKAHANVAIEDRKATNVQDELVLKARTGTGI